GALGSASKARRYAVSASSKRSSAKARSPSSNAARAEARASVSARAEPTPTAQATTIERSTIQRSFTGGARVLLLVAGIPREGDDADRRRLRISGREAVRTVPAARVTAVTSLPMVVLGEDELVPIQVVVNPEDELGQARAHGQPSRASELRHFLGAGSAD